MDKLKDMISESIHDGEDINPSVIAGRVNRNNESVKVSEETIVDFLENQYHKEEFEKVIQRHKGFYGNFYI